MEEGFEVVNLSASGVIPTPNIRTNGNWFVGNKDTGVAAKGETGAQGPQGEKGEKGEQGIQGIQGEKGEKGTDADTSELERLSNEVDTINQSLNKIGCGFSVSQSADISLPVGDTLLNFNIPNWNDGSFSLNTFTAPYSGVYSFKIRASSVITANTRIAVFIKINDTTTSYLIDEIITSNKYVNASCDVKLSTNDTVKMYVYSGAASQLSNGCTFSGGLIKII